MAPILFHLPGGWPVFGYGVMLGLSCVLGAHMAVHYGERSGIPAKRSWWFVVAVILIGISGGRLHELVVTGNLSWEALTQLQHSGRTAYGGYLSATLAAVFLAPLLGISFWRMADAVAPTLALGLGFTRIGCFMYGCDYGFQSERWGVVFPKGPLPGGSPAWRDHVEAGLIPLTASGSLPVFPAQLLASATGFLLFAGLLWLWYRRPRRAGTVLLAFFLAYGLARAGLEQLRSDMGRGELLGLSTSTTIGLISAAITAPLLWVPWLARLRPELGPPLPPPSDDDAPPPAEGQAAAQAEGQAEAQAATGDAPRPAKTRRGGRRRRRKRR